MVKFSKLFALSVFAAMTTAVIGQLGEDYCTNSPDTDCYVNGRPECCLDDSSECPEEKPPCNVVSSPSPTTPSPTSVPVPLPGADYCTYSPDTDCYANNGKPECCLDDSTDCPEEQPPCDIVNSPSPTAAPVSLVGADYCTYSPDTDCYANNGKPECCQDDSTDCPEEQPPCDIVNSPSPTAAPVPLVGADYCTYSPDTDCYANNGKPECCQDDSTDCPEEQPPCDIVNSPSPTAAPVSLVGADYCTYSPDADCYMNGKPECCQDDSTDCPDQKPPCDVTPSPTPLPSPGPTPASRRPTLEPTNSPTDRPTGRPTKDGDTPFPTFKATPQPTERPTNRLTNNPTKKREPNPNPNPNPSPPTVTPELASCEVNEACKSSGLEGQCCPTDLGDFLSCCDGTSDSYSLKVSSVSLCVSAIATLFVAFLL